jgi:hypothetical protein
LISNQKLNKSHLRIMKILTLYSSVRNGCLNIKWIMKILTLYTLCGCYFTIVATQVSQNEYFDLLLWFCLGSETRQESNRIKLEFDSNFILVTYIKTRSIRQYYNILAMKYTHGHMGTLTQSLSLQHNTLMKSYYYIIWDMLHLFPISCSCP